MQGFAQTLDLLGCLGVCLGRGITAILLHLLAEIFCALLCRGKFLVQFLPLSSRFAVGVYLADGIQILLQTLKIALPAVLGRDLINIFTCLGRHLLCYFFRCFLFQFVAVLIAS